MATMIILMYVTILLIGCILYYLIYIYPTIESFVNFTYLEQSVIPAVYNPIDTNNSKVNKLGELPIGLPVNGTINEMITRAINNLELNNVTSDFTSSERHNLIKGPQADTACPVPTTVAFNPKVSAPPLEVVSCESAMGTLRYLSGRTDERSRNNMNTIIVNYDKYFIENAQIGYVIYGSNVPANTTILSIERGVSNSGKSMIQIGLSNAIMNDKQANQQFCWQPPPMNCTTTYEKWSDCNGPCSSSSNNTSGIQTRTASTNPSNGKGLWGGQDCAPVLSQSCATNVCPLQCENNNQWNYGHCEFVDSGQTCGKRRKRMNRNGPQTLDANGNACVANDASNRTTDWDYSCSDVACGPVPLNCVVSDWSGWSGCNNGEQTRTRNIVTQSANGGEACPDTSSLIEKRTCSIVSCYYIPTGDLCSSEVGWSDCPAPSRCNYVRRNGTFAPTGTCVVPNIPGRTDCRDDVEPFKNFVSQ